MKKMQNIISIHRADSGEPLDLPYFMQSVSAGFPSPAEDYVEGNLDLNNHLIKNPASTFFVRVAGDSMVNAGIFSGDILIVDRSLIPKHNNVIIAIVDNELTVKRLLLEGDDIILAPENNEYNSLKITGDISFSVWGVVRNVIHSLL
jgi:DNA polymerase V